MQRDIVQLIENALLPAEQTRQWIRKIDKSAVRVRGGATEWSEVAYWSETAKLVPLKGSACLGLRWGREREDDDHDEELLSVTQGFNNVSLSSAASHDACQ
jgi:hypothetical protein